MNPKLSRYYVYIKPIVKNPSVKTYSGLIFSLVITSILAIFAIRPTVGTIISLQKSIDEQTTITNQLQTKIDDIEQGIQNYQNIPQEAKIKLSAFIPERTEVPAITQFLENLSRASGASISAIQFQPTQIITQTSPPSKNYQIKEVSFTFNLQADYPRLLYALDQINKSPRLISIQSVTLTKPKAEASTANPPVLMSVNAKSYFIENQPSQNQPR